MGAVKRRVLKKSVAVAADVLRELADGLFAVVADSVGEARALVFAGAAEEGEEGWRCRLTNTFSSI
jgi:hypothetical protein